MAALPVNKKNVFKKPGIKPTIKKETIHAILFIDSPNSLKTGKICSIVIK
jgi:hypothetical protein